MTALRNAACEAAARGWFVFPLTPRTKRPFPGTNGYHDATDDLIDTFKTWSAHPHANIGLACHASGLVAIDVDPRNGGDEAFAIGEKKLGRLPRTTSAVTGGGGAHYILQHPGGSLRGKLGDGLDLKDHGYILLSPSTHPNGERYEWDEHPDDVEPARMPDAWVEALKVSNSTRLSDPARAADPLHSPDPLRRIPASEYIPKLSGREVGASGMVQCPFHRGGQERTPSLSADGHIWACYGCEPLPGRRAMGGNIYDFAALLLGFALPPRGADYLETKDYLRRHFSVDA